MASTFPQRGILAALWTPLDQRGRLLKPALAAHLAFLRERGVHGVLALGSTGEFPRFTLKQRQEVLAAVIELAAPLPVVANISSIRLDEVIAFGRTARRLGAHGVALMPPYFFPVSQADMLEFFLRAADGVDLPFCLYNFPELTGNRIGLDVIAAFATRAKMAAIKQSGGEFAYHRPLVRLGREKGFAVFSGADTRLPEAFSHGAAGCIGGLTNLVPELMVEIFQQFQKGNRPALAIAAARMTAVGRIVDRLTFPLNVAAGMEARGLNPGVPKTVVSAESANHYKGIVRDLRQKIKLWKL